MDIRKWFGDLVHVRRRELGMTQQDVSAAGGPSYATLYKIERTDEPVGLGTFKKLDTALGWTPGGAARAYQKGVAPTPAAPESAAAKTTENEPESATTTYGGNEVTDVEMELAAALRSRGARMIALRSDGLSEQSQRAILEMVERAREIERLDHADDSTTNLSQRG
ncbi:helix-turn-helix domain-containing protein [Nocardia sp. NPDC051570]|uniref:helix-turn-helix domain-containing protein n=1 Tax=Nocardia sp. NPDC051570 TaxID=3364324 RepID=UPI00379DE233